MLNDASDSCPARRAGFILIELLVVIAIIAILASILFPVFAQVRRNAMKADCISNLRQMGLAVAMYSEEWRAYPLHSWKEMGMPGYRWMNALIPYHKNTTGLFVCKSAARPPANLDTSGQVYGYNYQYLGNGRARPGTVLTPMLLARESLISSPSQTVAIAESGGRRSLIGTAQEQSSGYAVDPPAPHPSFGQFYNPGDPSVPAARHGGANVAFCDGHIALMRMSDLYDDNSHWNGRFEPAP